MRKTLLIFLISLLFGISLGNAQNKKVGSPSITNFSRLDYHAGTQNWAIEQDGKGIMFFANNKGLVEFDGTNWQTYPLPNGTVVRSLNIENDGKIYIGGQGELGYLEPDEKGKRTYTSLTNLIPEASRSFEDVWKIFVVADGIYFCSEKAVFHLQGNEMKVIPPKSQRFENFFEVNGKIFIQDQKEGFFQLQNNQLQAAAGGNLFPNQRIISILPFSKNQSLLITFSEGLFLMDASGIQPWDVPASNFLRTHQAYCAIELDDGKYAIGTPQNGILILNHKGAPELHLNKNKGLQNNTVLSVAQDSQKNLWLGLDNGIDYAEISSPFSKIRTEESITGTGYASIIHEGNLYLGTNQGLFFTDWEGEKSPLEVQKFQPVKNGLGQVWDINEVDNQIIVGQHQGASYLNNEKLNLFSTVQGAWKFTALESHEGYAIEGTYRGFFLYKNKNFEKITIHFQIGN